MGGVHGGGHGVGVGVSGRGDTPDSTPSGNGVRGSDRGLGPVGVVGVVGVGVGCSCVCKGGDSLSIADALVEDVPCGAMYKAIHCTFLIGE